MKKKKGRSIRLLIYPASWEDAANMLGINEQPHLLGWHHLEKSLQNARPKGSNGEVSKGKTQIQKLKPKIYYIGREISKTNFNCHLLCFLKSNLSLSWSCKLAAYYINVLNQNTLDTISTKNYCELNK